MAGDFILLRTSLPTCREVVILADLCRCESDLILGRLARFWIWADAETSDGDLRGVSVDMLAKTLHMPKSFFTALVSVGWLEVHEWGLRIPNWDRWFSDSSKARYGEIIRKRLQRSRDAPNGEFRTNVRTISGQCPDNVRTKEERRESKEERRKKTEGRSNPSVTLECNLQPSGVGKSLSTGETQSCFESSGNGKPMVDEDCGETKFCSEIGTADSPPSPAENDRDVPEEVARLTFPCDGPTKGWRVTRDVFVSLQEAFSTVDVVAEIRRAYEWILANPDRRKTAKGMRRFLFNWLSRAVDGRRSTSRAPPGPVLSDLERRNLEATKLWLAQKEQQHAN